MGTWGLKLMVLRVCMGGFGFGKRNVEGEMILETADALNLAVLNKWFRKERRLFTYITAKAGLWLITSCPGKVKEK